jgi:anti-sigma factor RsiW
MAQADSNAELMSAYLDDQLDPDEAQAFESLVDADPEVRRELTEMQQMLRMVSALPEVAAPPDFYEKVAKKARTSKMDPQGLLLGLISLPFQVLSIVIILIIAATFLMLELDRDVDRFELEHDPSAQSAEPGDGPDGHDHQTTPER